MYFWNNFLQYCWSHLKLQGFLQCYNTLYFWNVVHISTYPILFYCGVFHKFLFVIMKGIFCWDCCALRPFSACVLSERIIWEKCRDHCFRLPSFCSSGKRGVKMRSSTVSWRCLISLHIQESCYDVWWLKRGFALHAKHTIHWGCCVLELNNFSLNQTRVPVGWGRKKLVVTIFISFTYLLCSLS